MGSRVLPPEELYRSATVVVDTQHTAHAGRAHSLISASGAYRWWVCPDSVTVFGNVTGRTSIYAAEGTAAHELANYCLMRGTDADAYIGREFNEFVVTEEMSDAVQIYLDKCREYMGSDWIFWVECRFSLEALDPPAPMFGTADFVAYNATTHQMVVVDLKYGEGILVSPIGNPQLRYYALGAYYAIEGSPQIDTVEMVIVQPRAPRGEPIKSDTISLMELLDWTLALMDRATVALSGNGGMKAGEHCKFCPGSGQCAVEAEAAIASAQEEFANADSGLYDDNDLLALASGEIVEKVLTGEVVTEDTVMASTALVLPETISPPDVRVLTPEQISHYLLQVDRVESWIKALKETAHALIDQGVDIPEFKLVDKQPTSKWKNEDEAAKVLIGRYGLDEDDIYTEPKLLSPAQAREIAIRTVREQSPMMKKKDIAARVVTILAPYIATESSGPTLVHVSDSRPAIAGRGEEFEDLPALAKAEAEALENH